MRAHKLIGLTLAAVFLFTGCAQSGQPENQAIAISLSVDKTDTDEIQVAVQLPNFGKSGGGGESGSEQSGNSYILASGTASDFTEALNIMRSTIPRSLNLAQLKSVVVSQELAESDRFSALVSDMLLTNRLYSAAYFIVSLGSAKDLISAQQSSMGVHLSSIVLAGLENFVHQNRIPDVRLVDVYYALNSIYGNPIAIFAATSDGTHTKALEEGRAGEALPGALPREGQTKNEYAGTALFRDGRMVGTLNSLETGFCNLLRGEQQNIPYSCDGSALELSPVTGANVTVDASANAPKIDLSVRFSVSSDRNHDQLRTLIHADISALIAKCQSLGVDPFLFSQRAASRFADNESWKRYDWASKFPGAGVAIRVEIQGLHE